MIYFDIDHLLGPQSIGRPIIHHNNGYSDCQFSDESVTNQIGNSIVNVVPFPSLLEHESDAR